MGTAIVYPTFLVAIAQDTSPKQRAESIGTFRLWRDSGYAFGALLSAIVSMAFSINAAIIVVGLLTLGSAVVIKIRMYNSQSK